MFVYIYYACIYIIYRERETETCAVREELDEPSVEADTVGRSEPHVFVAEAETSGGDRIGLCETRQHRHVD